MSCDLPSPLAQIGPDWYGSNGTTSVFSKAVVVWVEDGNEMEEAAWFAFPMIDGCSDTEEAAPAGAVVARPVDMLTPAVDTVVGSVVVEVEDTLRSVDKRNDRLDASRPLGPAVPVERVGPGGGVLLDAQA